MVNKAIEEAAKELNLPMEFVKKVYNGYWYTIKKKIQQMPLKEELTEDEYKNIQTSVNIPSLGKLHCTYLKYKLKHNRFNKTQDGNN